MTSRRETYFLSSRHQEVLDSRELVWLPVNQRSRKNRSSSWPWVRELVGSQLIRGGGLQFTVWEPFWFPVHEIGCVLDLRGEGTQLAVSGRSEADFRKVVWVPVRERKHVPDPRWGNNWFWSRLKRGQNLRELAQFSVDEKRSRSNIWRDLVLGLQ